MFVDIASLANFVDSKKKNLFCMKNLYKYEKKDKVCAI